MTQQHSYDNLTTSVRQPSNMYTVTLRHQGSSLTNIKHQYDVPVPKGTYILNLTLIYHDPQHSCTYIMAPQHQRMHGTMI